MKRPIKRLIAILAAALLIPTLAMIWLATSESGLRLTWQQAQAYLPGELKFERLEGRLTGPITMTKVRFQQSGTVIEAEQLVMNWRPGSLLAGSVDINQLHIRSATVSLAATNEENNSEALTLPEIHLPWQLGLKDVLIDGLRIVQNNKTFTLDQVKLNADALFDRINIETLDIKSEAFDLKLKGKLNPSRDYRHKLELRWRYPLPNAPALSVLTGSGHIEGDTHTSQFKQRIDGPMQATISGRIDKLLTQLHWQTEIKGELKNIALLDNRWPEISAQINVFAQGDLNSAKLGGDLNANHADTGPFDAQFKLSHGENNSVEIEDLKLHVATSNTQINVSGQWLLGSDSDYGSADLAMQWQNLRWPISGDAWFDSASGSSWIKGTPDQYRISVETDRPWPEAPPSHWYADAEGNLDGLNFHTLRISALEGETVIKGQLGWAPRIFWDAEIELKDINPATLYPEWPGKLRGTVFSRGGFDNDQLHLITDIKQIQGKLRNHPVSLRSLTDWRDNVLTISHFNFRSGNSLVKLRGHAGKKLAIDWSINSTNLAELHPLAAGQLNGKGHLGGTRQAPIIKASLSGKALQLPDYSAESIEARLDLDPMHWQLSDVQLSAEALRINDITLQALAVVADKQHIEAKVSLQDMELQLALAGQANAQGWQGKLEKSAIKHHRFGDWHLKAPAPLSLSETKIKLDSLCLQQQTSELCSRLVRDDKVWQGDLKLTQLPLALFSPWLPPDLDLEGVANGQGTFTYSQGGLLKGETHITLPAGAISYPLLESERNQWQYRSGSLALKLDDKGLDANSTLAISNGDHLKAHVRLPDAKLPTLEPTQQKIEAEAQLIIHDLAVIEALLDEVQDLRGEINLQLKAIGTLQSPRISGRANLKNGSLRIPRLGLSIDQLALTSQSKGEENLSFQLNAHSGKGSLSVQGQTALDKSAGWPTQLSIKGDAFEVSHIPEAVLEASPDLTVHIQNRSIKTEGEVHIPYARLQPKDITTAARVSEDAVIIGGELPPQEKWQITTRIRLILGERVNFYGFGFEGRFGGSLLLEDEPGQITTATGELNVPEGRYRAYGQRLDVEHGRLLYTGGPLTNPGLNFRSVRRIGNITAGLKLRGTLSQPQLELFSVPAMGETDALSYLLLGRPLENASGEEGAMLAKATLALGLSGGDRLARTLGERFGFDEMRVETSDTDDQASLVIGRYLSPKLYISYGVGLIEAINTFNVRYQISDKWQLKGESGEHQGADLFYSIER